MELDGAAFAVYFRKIRTQHRGSVSITRHCDLAACDGYILSGFIRKCDSCDGDLLAGIRQRNSRRERQRTRRVIKRNDQLRAANRVELGGGLGGRQVRRAGGENTGSPDRIRSNQLGPTLRYGATQAVTL